METESATENRGSPQRDWVPTDKQRLALECPIDELFFGGAKGGGKSEFLLVDYAKGVKYGIDFPGVIFRRTYPELEELIARSHKIYPILGGKYHVGNKTWHFPTGATLKFRFLEADKNVNSYQGHEYSWIGFDELTSWKSDYCYLFMVSCLRSTNPEINPTLRGSGNPGMVGHAWVKGRFIDIGPPGVVHIDPAIGLGRVFVPARLEDNPHLLINDPDYEKRLKLLPAHLYRQFRWGDWDVIAGQAIDEFDRSKHVVKPFALEPSWFRFASLDWAYTKPFSIGWWAITHDGRMIRYREWYGCEKHKTNTGIKMEATAVAKESWEMSVMSGCKDLVIDPSCWNKQGTGSSVAEIFEEAGWTCHRANNDRLNGLANFHDRMKTLGFDAQPMMIVFEGCRDWIRTIPVLVVDPKRPEDIDTDGEDHAYDETRYACMSELSHRAVAFEPKPRYEGRMAAFVDEKRSREYNPRDHQYEGAEQDEKQAREYDPRAGRRS